MDTTLYYKAKADANAFFKPSAFQNVCHYKVAMKSISGTNARRQRAQTRSIYEKYPYPAANRTALTAKRWHLAPMEWIMALWRPGNEKASPNRILVAGCGTGSEAFALARKFTTATIVAVDFSPRSIAIAKKLQRQSARMRKIRFVRADLTSRRLSKATGGNFDFISCHGVLSYIPGPERVLANLSRQLNPEGALFLGVNGSEHFSARGRPFLSSFGFNLDKLHDEKRLRDLFKVWNRLLESQGAPSLPDRGPGYLAGDLFGPLIHNWPLSRWVQLARKAGLHLCDNYSCWRSRRFLMEAEDAFALLPRSRAELSLLMDMVLPETFHRLLFVRRKPWNSAWETRKTLLSARPMLSQLYTVSTPRPPRPERSRTRFVLKSRPLNTRLDWKMPAWEAEIIRQSDGCKTVKEILAGVQGRVPRTLLRQQLYIMYQLLVLTLLPPNGKQSPVT